VEFKRRKKKDIPRIGHVSAISYLVLTYDNENRASKRTTEAAREGERKSESRKRKRRSRRREGGMAG